MFTLLPQHQHLANPQRAYPLLSLEFGGAAEAYLGVVQRTLAAIALAWASSAHGETVGPLDAQYLGHLLAISGPDVQVDTSLRALASETGAATACPACGSPVEFGSGSSTYCSQGHEWGMSVSVVSVAFLLTVLRTLLHHASSDHVARVSSLHRLPRRCAPPRSKRRGQPSCPCCAGCGR